MTPASQHPATPPRRSGADGEETVAAATAATESSQAAAPGEGPESQAGSTRAKAAIRPATTETAEGAEEAGETGDGAAKGESVASAPAPESTAAAGRGSDSAGVGGATANGGRTEAEAEADGAAVAEAKSRLPAFVRTMSATAINQPRQESGPVGRPRKTMLYGAAAAGVLLVSVPFLANAGKDDGPKRSSTAAAGTVLGGNTQEAPGDFKLPVTQSPSSSPSVKAKKEKKTPPPPTPKAETSPAKQPVVQSTPQSKSKAKPTPKPTPVVTLSSPVSPRSGLSGRCLDVPASTFYSGAQLSVWDCNNGPAQQWQFGSDGTIRIKNLCMDVVSLAKGYPITITNCDGDKSQNFVLNQRHELRNNATGLCVDIKGDNPGNGASLQLWDCLGTKDQMWLV
ncbi:hypothetical protein M2160_008948 [Streptomyces sp. SAI-117]|uniref:RICIN domain-containing protein n=1 Tax=Streptomyces sp. SAI-117 TaxID=2940546 RepID=UPI002473D4C9|nr:RICIN domain-containing protein [Streptomyces sp. SAI-117]MDH6573841.1 hypothetical protein [Streptomyces sp. SAI-117]